MTRSRRSDPLRRAVRQAWWAAPVWTLAGRAPPALYGSDAVVGRAALLIPNADTGPLFPQPLREFPQFREDDLQ